MRLLLALGAGAAVLHLAGSRDTLPLHALAARPHSWLQWSSGALIASWALYQLVSRGPRIWFGEALFSARPRS